MIAERSRPRRPAGVNGLAGTLAAAVVAGDVARVAKLRRRLLRYRGVEADELDAAMRVLTARLGAPIRSGARQGRRGGLS